jgi:hypothetical protein
MILLQSQEKKKGERREPRSSSHAFRLFCPGCLRCATFKLKRFWKDPLFLSFGHSFLEVCDSGMLGVELLTFPALVNVLEAQMLRGRVNRESASAPLLHLLFHARGRSDHRQQTPETQNSIILLSICIILRGAAASVTASASRIATRKSSSNPMAVFMLTVSE